MNMNAWRLKDYVMHCLGVLAEKNEFNGIYCSNIY